MGWGKTKGLVVGDGLEKSRKRGGEERGRREGEK